MSVAVDTCFARQPIFDRCGDVVGYELLYRASPEAVAATGDPAVMAAQVVSDALLGMDLAAVTDDMPAFINAPRSLLLSGVLAGLDPERIVVEVLETVEVDDEIVLACRRLASAGHTIALDDWIAGDGRAPLLEWASIVKVDVLGRDRTDVLASVAPIAGRPGIRLLAERVETRDAYSMWADAGFELFQGYFHRRPELVQRRDLRPEQLQVIEAMNLIQDAATSDQQVAGHIRRNPTLAYKVVRMANVAMLGGRRIESVQHAIALVGRGALLRWLALMLAASWGRENGTSRALLREALLRARMCELLAEGTERPSGHLFLIGLFSRIDALLGVPMDELLRHVALPDPATAALLRRAGPYAPVLTLVEAWEEGRWSDVDCRAPEAPCVRLPAAWGEAVGWADAVSREI